MFFRVFSRRRLTAVFTTLLLAVILLCTVVLRAATPTARRGTANGVDPAARILFLKNLGYEVDEIEAEESKNITVPQSFNQVYSNYNNLQKRAGLDLTPYRGQGAVLYTYKIKDAQRNDIYAHLIVLNNEIIGGDITAISVTDGYELPLIKR